MSKLPSLFPVEPTGYFIPDRPSDVVFRVHVVSEMHEFTFQWIKFQKPSRSTYPDPLVI